jgi:hypothetical protein
MRNNMMRLFLYTALLVIFIGSCSSNKGPIVPQDTLGESGLTGASADSQNGRALWGMYEWTIDLQAGTSELVPMRNVLAHFNVVKAMNQKVDSIRFDGFVLDKANQTIGVDVTLDHPYPGIPGLAGFDVHGIMIGPGSVSGYSDPSIVLAGFQDPHMLNPDGWTRWWNPVEFNVGNDLFSYTDGKRGGVKASAGFFNATLNAYKVFADDLGNTEPLENLSIPDRLVFTPGVLHSRHYDIWFPMVQNKYILKINYAIDASWEPIPGYKYGDPVNIPSDWEPTANQAEPFLATMNVIDNSLYYASSVAYGGDATIQVKVYDWQGYLNTGNVADQVSFVKFESPEGYTGTEMGTVVDIGSGSLPFATYNIELDGKKLLGNQARPMLLTVGSVNGNYEPGLSGYSGTAPLAYYRLMALPSISPVPLTKPIDLGAAASFGGMGGGSGLTNEGIYTVISGDIGTTGESTTVTGFHDSVGDIYTETPLNAGAVNGRIYTAPPAPGGAGVGGTAETFAIALAAASAALDAWNSISPASLPGGADPGDGQLGGLTLAPGVYKAAGGTFLLTGSDLTLNGKGDLNSVWVFQTEAELTIGSPGYPRNINLINGAQAKNVFWYVGSAARIEDRCNMVGTIIAYSGVTISTHDQALTTTLDGRALGLNASVTVVNTHINVPVL